MRKLLDEIIRTDGGDNWWKPELFREKTLKRLPKELEILQIPPEEDKNYNCFIYVFGLADDTQLIKESGGFIYDTFFQKLIDKGELVYSNDLQPGDYILYKDTKNYPDMITHVGVLCDKNTVISKWAWGPLFKHKILDVPESYGDDILYVKAISKEKALELYEKYKELNVKPE